MALKRTFFKDRRVAWFSGYRERVQTISITGAATGHELATVVSNIGITVIKSSGTGGPHRLALPAPPGGGVQKKIILAMATTQDVIIRNAGATGAGQLKFFGTTFGGVHFTTSVAAKPWRYIELLSVSSTAWQIITSPGSTVAGSRVWASTNSTK